MSTLKLYKMLAVVGFALFAAALGQVALADWTAPTNSPPACPSGQPGCDAPINVSGNAQVKSGGLTLGGPLQVNSTFGVLDKTFLVGATRVGSASTASNPVQLMINAGGSNGGYASVLFGDNSVDGFVLAKEATAGDKSFGIWRGPFGSGSRLVQVTPAGNVGVGGTPSSGSGGQLKVDVEGNVGATKYCDNAGNNCYTTSEMFSGGSGGGAGDNLGDHDSRNLPISNVQGISMASNSATNFDIGYQQNNSIFFKSNTGFGGVFIGNGGHIPLQVTGPVTSYDSINAVGNTASVNSPRYCIPGQGCVTSWITPGTMCGSKLRIYGAGQSQNSGGFYCNDPVTGNKYDPEFDCPPGFTRYTTFIEQNFAGTDQYKQFTCVFGDPGTIGPGAGVHNI